jgi:hypothetical protein
LTAGAQATLSRVAEPIQLEYGERPISFEIYVMVHPPQMRLAH